MSKSEFQTLLSLFLWIATLIESKFQSLLSHLAYGSQWKRASEVEKFQTLMSSDKLYNNSK